MLKFVILADDCTGALDAAVPFVKQSIPVQVFLTGFPEAEALGKNMKWHLWRWKPAICPRRRHMGSSAVRRNRPGRRARSISIKRRIPPCGATSARSLGP